VTGTSNRLIVVGVALGSLSLLAAEIAFARLHKAGPQTVLILYQAANALPTEQSVR
jgi:hypothetical protein